MVGQRGAPELAQSQQGSPVPTFAAMAWKIVLMWGLWKEEGTVRSTREGRSFGLSAQGPCSESNGCAQLPRETLVPAADRPVCGP